ncbi:hypothetical protein AGRO_3995 [Agrobacterium sp. ATCC 31749]|nr:hypothetical protein AGRO_3995 [Agrobacterium sp. ATCC 31749]
MALFNPLFRGQNTRHMASVQTGIAFVGRDVRK